MHIFDYLPANPHPRPRPAALSLPDLLTLDFGFFFFFFGSFFRNRSITAAKESVSVGNVSI
jgi:hypothetical protein